MSYSLSPMFSSKFLWFQVLHLSSIYFKMIFVYNVQESKFILLHVDIQFLQHHF